MGVPLHGVTGGQTSTGKAPRTQERWSQETWLFPRGMGRWGGPACFGTLIQGLAWFRKGSLVQGQGQGEGKVGTASLFYPRKEYELGAGGVKGIGLPSNKDDNDSRVKTTSP